MANTIVSYTGAKPVVFDSAVALGVATASAIATIEGYDTSALESAERAEAAAGLLDTTWTPARLTTLCWLDVGNPAKVFSDLSGTTPAVEGGPVGYIRDDSGNSRHWTAPANGNRATYRKTTDGRWYVEFDGTDDGGWIPNFTAVAQPYTRMSLIHLLGHTANDRLYDGGTGDVGALIQIGSDAPLLYLGSTTQATYGEAVPIGVDFVCEEVANGAASSIRQDDLSFYPGNSGSTGIDGWTIGGRRSGASSLDRFANFRFYGGFLVAGALSGADRKGARDFFKRRRSFLSSRKQINCVGDSLTRGVNASTPRATSYPGRLAARLGSGYTTWRRGVTSQQSHNIACRMNALAMTVSLTGNGIPASGAVSCTILSPLSTAGTQATSGPLANETSASDNLNSVPVTITADNGTKVEGLFSVGSSGVYSFTRLADGEPLAVSSGAAMNVIQTWRDFTNTVIWAGRNNLTETRVITDIAAMVASLKGAADYIVLGITNSRGGTEDTGSTNHTAMLARNATLASTYGTRFINIYDWLRDTSASGPYVALGLSSAGDAADIAAGRIGATWLSGDNLHFNDNGYDAIALTVANKVTALGW